MTGPGPDLERIARALHETSVAMQDGERSDPVYLNWEDLPVRERKWFFAFALTARRETLDGLAKTDFQMRKYMTEANWRKANEVENGARVLHANDLLRAVIRHELEK